MPSKSKAQERFMRIASKSKKFAKKVGIPQHVAEEFHEADKQLRGKQNGTKHSKS